LLCHRSGLADHAGDLLEDLGYDRNAVLHRLRFDLPASSFRSKYAYTNFGYTQAAIAGARATGKVWEDVAVEKLFGPLGMSSSSFRFADYAAAANRARLHVRADGKWTAKNFRDPDAQSPAGGASSTLRDMTRWLRLHLGGGKFDGKQVIAATALAETHRPQIVSHPPANAANERAGWYGLGWNVGYDEAGRVRLGHSGGFALGAATYVGFLPGEGLGIVALSNGMPIGVPEAVGASFFDLVLAGRIAKDWLVVMEPSFTALSRPEYGLAVDYSKLPADRSPPRRAADYLGKYGNDYYGDIEVAEENGALVLRLGPKLVAYRLQHWNRDTFSYQPPGENAGGLSGVTFCVCPDQKQSRVVVENLDVRGQGTFSRRISGK
jgi:CubicO group peptidase (beta-lactamase class C family)